MQQFQSLCYQLVNEKIDTRRVSAGPGEAGDETKSDRVFASGKDYGDRCGCRLGGECSGRRCGRNHGDTPANQVSRKFRQSFELTVSPAQFKRNVLAFDVSGLPEALAKSAQIIPEGLGRLGMQKSNHRHRRLLRACRERPRDRRAAEQGDKLAALHSITSSVRASSVIGRSKPSALAVFRLITSWNLVACCTGRSAGFSPLRMRST